MAGSRWHGYDEEDPRKIWSVDDCQRNRFQLGFLCGEDVYAWFDRPLVRHEYRPLTAQRRAGRRSCRTRTTWRTPGLTYHYQIFGAEMGTGKTLAAQMVMEKSGVDLWWWAGPKTSLPNIKRELKLWGFPFDRIQVEFFTYEGLVRVMDEWDGSQTLPRGFVADESSRCKNHTSQRSKACQKLADLIRDKYGFDGYVIEMSGTPSPKTPVDWWSQCEIAWPGFLKEGSPRAMEERLAFMVQQQYDGHPFKKRIGWKDDERKCAECGETLRRGAARRMRGPGRVPRLHAEQERGGLPLRTAQGAGGHQAQEGLPQPAREALPQDRLQAESEHPAGGPGDCQRRAQCRHRHDALARIERRVPVPRAAGRNDSLHALHGRHGRANGPTRTTQSGSIANISMLPPEVVARLVKQTVPCPVCGGKREVPKVVRVARELPCPKDAALKMLLEENEETGPHRVFAGFTGSVDRIVRLCLKEKWDVVRCDQGNFQVFAAKSDSPEGVVVTGEEPLDYWANMDHGKVAFVANPESGGMSLTLVEARMAVYWSNSWKPEYRVQSEDRIHRKGMDENLGCTIVDLIHLPSDERVLDVIRANRRLELMTMGEVLQGVDWTDAAHEGEIHVEEVAP